MTHPLTNDEKLYAFRKATHGFEGSAARWAEHARTGLTDEQLADVLRFEIGIFGGSCGPGEMDLMHQGAGQKIWASWSIVNHVTDPPIFEGAATVAMAREVYGIRDPDDQQLTLF